MTGYSTEMRERARRLRDELLESVEDKTDPRYLEIMAQIAEDDAKAGRLPASPKKQLAS